MAKPLLFGLAESLLWKVASRAVEEASLALGVFNDLQEMKDTVLIIKGVLLDAEQKQNQNHAVREWLRQIKRVFHDAEDLIDDFECEALRKQLVKTSGSIGRKVRRYLSTSSNPLAYRLRKAHEIKDIKKRLDKVAADRLKFGLQINDGGDNHVMHQRELTHSHVVDSDVIGRENDKEKIIDLLMQDDDQSILSVVPIVGIGGLGKTTLAKSVFNDKRLNDESFPLKMWVCVSQDFDLKNVLVKILKSATKSAPQENFKNFDMEQLKNHLRNTLNSQKFLLILDDVWNEDRVKWVELKNLIQVGVQGCKVLVTTRSHIVANVMGTHTSHILQGLSKKDSLSVFVKWAFKDGEEKRYPQLMEIGKDIVQKCGGLPLALRTLGSSLFLKNDIQDWMFVRDNDIWKLPQNDEDVLPAIKLSYDQLPFYLKPCFACFSLFEKDFQFNSVKVIMFWEALGFLSSFKKGKTSGDIGNQFLRELLSRSFLQDLFDFGTVYKFTLHDIVHDLALYVAEDEFQIIKPDSKNISENVLYLKFREYYLLGQISIPNSLRLRTIFFPWEADDVVFFNTLVARCKHLRVLEMAKSNYERLPYSIGKLKHLRYINLHENEKLTCLPDSVCQLQNLISLNLKSCTNLQTLPSGIGNLVNLLVLIITTKQSKFPNEEIAKLTSLEMLGIYYCDNLESLFEGIQLPSLRSLFLKSCLKLKSVSLRAIPNLETLFISSCKLLNLSMVGHHNQVPKLNLKTLILGYLPQLVTFPDEWCLNTLQTLAIHDCENLEELPKCLTNVTCLKTIEITDCEKLISLPDGVHRLPGSRKA